MTTYDSGAAEPLTIGCPVFTSDGDEIGRVKEIRGRYFKVDAPMRPDYWLSRETVTASHGGAVTIGVDKKHLGDVKVKHPDEAMPEVSDSRAASEGMAQAREGLLTAYPPGAPVGASEYATPAVNTGAPAGAMTWNDVSPRFRDAWTRRYGSMGRTWEQDEPAYRYGWETAAEERYLGREWPEVENDLGLGFRDWATSSGYTGEYAWEGGRDYAREGWEWRRSHMP